MDSNYLFGIFFFVVVVLMSYLYLQQLNLADRVNLLFVKNHTQHDDCFGEEDLEGDFEEDAEDSECESEEEQEKELKVESLLEE